MNITNVKIPHAIVIVTDQKSMTQLLGLDRYTKTDFYIENATYICAWGFSGKVRTSIAMLKTIWSSHKPEGTQK